MANGLGFRGSWPRVPKPCTQSMICQVFRMQAAQSGILVDPTEDMQELQGPN